MKRRYLLLHDKELSPTTAIYTVWLGENAHDRRLRLMLTKLAATDTDWYFKPYDWQACEFIQNIADQFGLFYSQLNTQQITAEQIKTTCLSAHVKNLSIYQ